MVLLNVRNVWSAVTCEPVLLLYFTGLALSQISGQNLLLQKACHLGLQDAPKLTANCTDEVESQKIVTQIQSWRDSITLCGPVLFVLFAGPWSDSHGKHRKPLMWLPLCGQIVSDLLSVLNVYFWSWSPSVAALSQSLPAALSGWRSCFLIGAVSYVSDISPLESRTVRAGICSALYFFGSPIGATLFGLFFHTVGFYGVFLLSVVLNSTALLYLVLFVSDSDPVKLKESKLKAWEGLMDPRQALQSLKSICKPRKGYQRAVVVITVLVAPITMAPMQGEFTILLFFVRYKFEWNEVQYGYYTAYKCFIIFFGTVITTAVFSRLLALSDAVVGMMASATLILASVGYAFAEATWQLFFYPIVDFMHGAALAVVYSIVSKIVEDVELGQAYSMIGVADALYPLVNLPLYNQLYNHTFTRLAGAVFLLSGFYGALALAAFGLVFILQRPKTIPDTNKENT